MRFIIVLLYLLLSISHSQHNNFPVWECLLNISLLDKHHVHCDIILYNNQIIPFRGGEMVKIIHIPYTIVPENLVQVQKWGRTPSIIFFFIFLVFHEVLVDVF